MLIFKNSIIQTIIFFPIYFLLINRTFKDNLYILQKIDQIRLSKFVKINYQNKLEKFIYQLIENYKECIYFYLFIYFQVNCRIITE